MTTAAHFRRGLFAAGVLCATALVAACGSGLTIAPPDDAAAAATVAPPALNGPGPQVSALPRMPPAGSAETTTTTPNMTQSP